MSIDDLAKQLPEDCVWYLAKCHKDDMQGKHYAEMTIRVGSSVNMEFCYSDTAYGAMSGLVNKVLSKR